MEQYMNLYNTYSKHNDRVVIIYERGSFCEIYGYEQSTYDNLINISNILNISIGRLNNIPIIGFLISNKNYYISKLTDEYNYTCIITNKNMLSQCR